VCLFIEGHAFDCIGENMVIHLCMHSRLCSVLLYAALPWAHITADALLFLKPW